MIDEDYSVTWEKTEGVPITGLDDASDASGVALNTIAQRFIGDILHECGVEREYIQKYIPKDAVQALYKAGFQARIVPTSKNP